MKQLALAAIMAVLPVAAAQHRDGQRSEPRDEARGQRHYYHQTKNGFASQVINGHGPDYCATCERDANGRIRRSPETRRAFQASHPRPATGLPIGACHGYVVDHIIPLKRGGPDDPSNMQWQTVEEAKAKDRVA